VGSPPNRDHGPQDAQTRDSVHRHPPRLVRRGPGDPGHAYNVMGVHSGRLVVEGNPSATGSRDT
jgi:hypothetical protein